MPNSQEVENNVLIPCLKNGEVVFNLKTTYITNDNQILQIKSFEFENPSQVSKLDRNELLNDLLSTMVLFGVQSEHARKQWQALEQANNQLVETYQKLEAQNNELLDKVSVLIQQGIISQEQFDNTFVSQKK